ncbi:MAG: GatB/YqeY domain-containing protein [Dehalococcoidia bacterium]|nr:GatB/YqeY domain-containing protein [Dehalococcoidia bacterium]
MPIEETVRFELTAAIKGGDTRRRDIMRLLLSAIGNGRIAAGHELDDRECIAVLQREAKQRRDSIAEYRKGRREDLARAEEEELEVIASFVPAALSDDELRALARSAIAAAGASGPGDLGKVMGQLVPRLEGRADGRRASELVRELLASG